jgi:TetR/AcrR family transcriptional regulator, tetracycline repressor protein
MGRPKAGQESLSRERILTVALQMVDEHGMKGLSMRRLAAELEVDPMAIYYHLPNKQAILAGLVERVFAELRMPPARSELWQERVRAVARAYHGLARAHPNLVLYLVTDRESAAVAALDLNEALYEALREGGLSPRMIVRASDLVVDYVNGFALAEVSGSTGQPDEWWELLTLLDGQPLEQFPALRYVFSHLPGEDSRDGFEAGLDIIVAGIAATAEADQEGDGLSTQRS